MSSETHERKPCPHGYTHCVPCLELHRDMLAAFPIDREWIRPVARFGHRNHVTYETRVTLPLVAASWRARDRVTANPNEHREAWLETLQDIYTSLDRARGVLLPVMHSLHQSRNAPPSVWNKYLGGKS